MIHGVSQRVMLGLSVATPVAGKYHCTLGELVTYANYRAALLALKVLGQYFYILIWPNISQTAIIKTIWLKCLIMYVAELLMSNFRQEI